MLRALSTLLLSLLCAASVGLAGEPPATPFIRIDTDMHAAKVMDVASDRAGKILATASFDKTVKVWDADSGKLLQTLRVPIADGLEGVLHAVAISPDGSMLAAAGFTGKQWDDSYCIYLFDLKTGRMVSRLTGFSHQIHRLAYAPDGSRLAATVAFGGGVHVFSTTDNRKIFADTDYKGHIFSIDFSASGTLAAASDQGEFKHYRQDGSKIFSRTSELGARIASISFSPDGKLLAMGYEPDSRREVDLLDAASGAWHSTLQGVQGPLMSVAWSRDGTRILAAGGKANKAGDKLLYVWDVDARSLDQVVGLPVRTPVRKLLPLPGGAVAFASRVGGFGVFSGRGTTVIHQTERKGGQRTSPVREMSGGMRFFHPIAVADFQKNHDTFLLSADGSRVLFSYERYGQAKALFDLKNRQLSTTNLDTSGLAAPRVTGNGLDIQQWDTVRPVAPKLNKKQLKGFGNVEYSRSLAVSPDSSGFVIGSSHYLRAYEKSGALTWKRRIPENAWDVNISADNKTLAAAFDDGTIRWYRLVDGSEICALYLHPDRKRWVMWLPDGYFDHAPGAASLIGFLVNRGRDREASLVPIERMYDLFYRPDIIEKAVTGQDISGYLKRLDSIAAAPSDRAKAEAERAAWEQQNRERIARENQERERQQKAEAEVRRLAQEQQDKKQAEQEQQTAALHEADPKPSSAEPLPGAADIQTEPTEAEPLPGERPAVVQSSALDKLVTAATLPPRVSFITRPTASAQPDIKLVAEMCDSGGGIGDIVISINGTPVALERGDRGLRAAPRANAEPCISLERILTLADGANTISLMAFNRTNTIESERDAINVTYAAPPARPRLHILTVAINRYRDGDLRLKYPIRDAEEVTRILVQNGSQLFSDIKVHQLHDEDVTRQKLAARFKEIGTTTAREDVFLLFLAGHGVTGEQDGIYYFLPVDFRYTGAESIARQGISMNDFKRFLSDIQAMKSLILLDTCSSGAFADAIASRGITEKTAITKLSRAVGRATIAASSKDQVALEGYEGHGVFSFTVIEGLKGKASGPEGRITINRLATFIEETLPALTFKKWGYEQIPQKSLTGNDFPIGVK